MDKTLEEKAAALGILPQFIDATGTLRKASDQTILRLTNALDSKAEHASRRDSALLVSLDEPYENITVRLSFPVTAESECRILLEDGRETKASTHRTDAAINLTFSVPFGYHKLVLNDRSEATIPLIATPKRCWFPDGKQRFWGISLQLYLVRSSANWGIGDFADLKKIVQFFGPLGCDLVGINPLHQLDIETPSAASPYSPLSRRFLNVLYISVPSVPGFSESVEVTQRMQTAEFKDALERARSSQHVDYEAVAALKIPVLEGLFREFDTTSLDVHFDLKTSKRRRGRISIRIRCFMLFAGSLSSCTMQITTGIAGRTNTNHLTLLRCACLQSKIQKR